MIKFKRNDEVEQIVSSFIKNQNGTFGIVSIQYGSLWNISEDQSIELIEKIEKSIYSYDILKAILEEGVLSRELMMKAHQLIYPELHKVDNLNQVS